MAYQLNVTEPLPSEIKRIAEEEIQEVFTCLTKAENQPVGVHEARKSLKKLRALLRFVRSDLKPKLYLKENASFRDAGRMLAPARDNFVMYETLNLLRPCLDAEDRKTLNVLRRHYKNLYMAEQKAVLEDDANLQTIQKMLEKSAQRLSKWTISDDGFVTLYSGVERIYRQGLRQYQKVRKNPTPEMFHEWRKDVKYLWYSVRLLMPIWEDVMQPLANELKQLGETLGASHDLAVLAIALTQLSDEYDVMPLIEACDGERRRLEQEALINGARLYAESSSAFANRLQAYWLVSSQTPDSK